MRRYTKAAFVLCLAFILYLIATNSGAGWLYVLAAVLGSTLLVSIPAPLYNVRRLRVERRAPVVGTAGEPLPCEIEVKNEGRLARYLLEVHDDFAGGTGGGVVARVGRGASASFGYTIENPLRGVYSGGEVTVESAAPFGLLYGRRRLEIASRTVVYPKTFEVAGLPRPAAPEAYGTERDEAPTMHRGLGEEFWGVREYRPGDPARLVSWRERARSLAAGRLSVVEFARSTEQPLSVAMNLDPRVPEGVREMIISAGASLMVQALRDSREVAADAGLQRTALPERPDADDVLAWCAGLAASRLPQTEDAAVEILPSLRDAQPRGSGSVVLVSCYEFVGPGPWMTPEDEREFVERVEAAGRPVTRLGPDVEEPWRVA